MRFCGCLFAPTLLVLAAAPVLARAPAQTPLSYGDAWQQLLLKSDQLRAADFGVANSRELEAASRDLRLPEISLDLRQLDYQKTVEVPLGPLAPVLGPVGIPDPFEVDFGGWRTRPIATLTLPLYSGGQIGAAQRASAAAVRGAEAERLGTREALSVTLVRAYFGQQLAAQNVAVRAEVLAGLEQHLARALAFEREGLISRAQRLQAQVARDDAKREYLRARNQEDSARVTLASLLRSAGPVATTTPLFILPAEPAHLARGETSRLNAHPRIGQLEALAEQSREALVVEQARFKPQIFAFGQYDLYRDDALLTEPDWIYGVGVRYTLFSNSGRRENIRAARARSAQVEASIDETRVQLEILRTRAANERDSARTQFLLLQSDLELAAENLRLQEISFREGRATSLDVIDARLGLGRARIQRAEAAYHYSVALAQWLEAGGQAGQFEHFATDAARIIVE